MPGLKSANPTQRVSTGPPITDSSLTTNICNRCKADVKSNFSRTLKKKKHFLKLAMMLEKKKPKRWRWRALATWTSPVSTVHHRALKRAPWGEKSERNPGNGQWLFRCSSKQQASLEKNSSIAGSRPARTPFQVVAQWLKAFQPIQRQMKHHLLLYITKKKITGQ